MTAAGTTTCDGCDRERPAQQLEEVILPSGPMLVCPECRYHAEELAANETADCEGCGDSVTAVTLDRTTLPDGTTMILCPDCQGSVSAGDHPASETDGPSASAASATSTSDSSAATETSTRDAGSATDHGSTSGAGSTATTQSSGSAGATTNGGSTAPDDGSNAGEAVTDGATSKPATTQNACDQCGGLFSIELYKVTTVDGRTEEFCPDCKDEGIEEGIVRDVDLRRAQAYEALGLAGSASEDDVRQAYLQQVKETHPDRADGSRSEFMLVQQAYERLRDD